MVRIWRNTWRNPATGGDRRAGSLDPGLCWGLGESPGSTEITQPLSGSFREPLWFLACSIGMLSRAQWYREQANLALQRGHETRDPTLRAGFDELVREWLRLAEQAEWIENQQQPPLAKRITRRNRTGS